MKVSVPKRYSESGQKKYQYRVSYHELANKTPIRSWTELEQIYDRKALDKIDDTENRDNITLKGFIGTQQQAKN
jgi:hypothetical protein